MDSLTWNSVANETVGGCCRLFYPFIYAKLVGYHPAGLDRSGSGAIAKVLVRSSTYRYMFFDF